MIQVGRVTKILDHVHSRVPSCCGGTLQEPVVSQLLGTEVIDHLAYGDVGGVGLRPSLCQADSQLCAS